MKSITAALIVAVFIMASSAPGFVPFAQIADIPGNPGNDPDLTRAIQYIEAVNIVENDEVGLPAYPGAKVVQTGEGRNGILPMVRLLTADDVSNVVGFYRKQLSGWKFTVSGGTHMLWQGDETAAQQEKIPVIKIFEAGLFKKVIDSARTEISISYSP